LQTQCDKHAEEDKLYKKKDPNWISWLDAQRTRQNAIAHYEKLKTAKPRTPYKKLLSALRDVVLICFHTVAPPDVRAAVCAAVCCSYSLPTTCSASASFCRFDLGTRSSATTTAVSQST